MLLLIKIVSNSNKIPWYRDRPWWPHSRTTQWPPRSSRPPRVVTSIPCFATAIPRPAKTETKYLYKYFRCRNLMKNALIFHIHFTREHETLQRSQHLRLQQRYIRMAICNFLGQPEGGNGIIWPQNIRKQHNVEKKLKQS